MNIGEKIKRIRQHRRMTQKELGELVDLSANRIAQYEMGYRVPKKPLLNQIAEALRVSPLALSDGGNGPANDILEQLFWLDEEQPGVIKLVPTERGTARYNANPNFALHYDDNDNLSLIHISRTVLHIGCKLTSFALPFPSAAAWSGMLRHSVFPVNMVGFACALNTLDCFLCNLCLLYTSPE